MRTRIRIGLAVVALVMTVPAEAAKKPLKVKLRFSPQENVTAAVPNIDQASTTRPIQVVSLTDERALDDKALIGENRESSTPVPVYALSSVAEFATDALRTCLLGWGAKIAPDADLVLKGAIVTLFVTEGNTYVANARLRFRLESRAGEALWEGLAAGDATRWGRSLSTDNYNEEISDALKKAYADLLSNVALQDAWAGRAKGARAGQSSIAQAPR